MKASILHESKGRIRFLVCQSSMTLHEADLLENWFQKKEWIKQVTVHERTRCVILQYRGSRQDMIEAIRTFTWEEAEKTVLLPMHSSRELNRNFQEKLRQHRTIAEASAVESPIRQETIGFPAHFFARAHNFKPPGRACQPEADSPMRT